MLTPYAGWGMRIEFVPDDQLHRRPKLVVREPDPENIWSAYSQNHSPTML